MHVCISHNLTMYTEYFPKQDEWGSLPSGKRRRKWIFMYSLHAFCSSKNIRFLIKRAEAVDKILFLEFTATCFDPKWSSSG